MNYMIFKVDIISKRISNTVYYHSIEMISKIYFRLAKRKGYRENETMEAERT